jgi:hypothetical protein
MPINISGTTISGSTILQLSTTNIIKRGLVLHLDVASTNSYPGSGTSWYDLSGNVYNGTLNNGPTYSSTNNGYLSFNGSNQNVTLPAASIPYGNQISFCVWNYGIQSIASSVIECRDSGGGRTINVHLPWSNNTIYFDCGNDRLQQAVSDAEYMGWRYWCFTKNVSTGTMVIYRNGSVWASSTGNVGTITTTTAARLCSYAIDTTYHNGYLGNVQIYNRTLSSTEVTQNYNIQKGRFGL